MRLPLINDLYDAGSRLLGRAGDLVSGGILEQDVRLGVTGLRRAGKTVFVTALVDNLLKAGRLPFLDVVSSGRFQASRLRPQPDPDVPRFELEDHLAALTGPDPHWPERTRGISQLRLSMRYRPNAVLKRTIQPVATLNLDIIDYPGEWLLDLPLLHQSFAEWSALTLDLAGRPPRDELSQSWRGWLATIDPAAPAEEEEARRGAALYTDYLHACRRSENLLSLIQPGRFVEPGDLANAPLLTFCPLPGDRRGRGSLWALMEDRYEAYKKTLVRGFFAEHFAKLDRQIVLIDVLGALNSGPAGMSDMKRALELSLEPFRHGSSGWLDWLLGTKIDRVLFAATKADHVASHQHNSLRHLLDRLVSDARSGIRFEGAQVETMAIAALKSTETVVSEHEGRQLRCVRGVPIGRDRPTVLYPGEIPEDADFPPGRERPYNFMAFQPPADLARETRGLPHIRLDQALQFLLGDYLE
ncbi:YcjX family protein [Azospirillum rugosum]|uniref:YcjX-like family ATPase n=1 Tax=Azospirillum rugosum TaxID=416170 RepID=A0ABS4SCX1_9PROT|nr:YcjX family protein [Azospirillum rugosum]MBP2290411.1 putative YcjX-like family ATPase [Azospirillum rugosum]MDQ0527887.1 putative YcjX-like family ATPase [Azospirillum rugosum]